MIKMEDNQEFVLEEITEKSELEEKIDNLQSFYFKSRVNSNEVEVYKDRSETIDEQLRTLANIEIEELSDNELNYIDALLATNDQFLHFNNLQEYIDFLDEREIEFNYEDLEINVCSKCINDFYCSFDNKESLFCRHNLIGESWIQDCMDSDHQNYHDKDGYSPYLEDINKCDYDLDEEERDRGLNRESFVCYKHYSNQLETSIEHKFICPSCLELTSFYNRCSSNVDLDDNNVVLCEKCNISIKNPANLKYYLRRKQEEQKQ